MKIETSLELKNVLVGIYKYQLAELKDFCEAHGYSRAAVIRAAIDLWLRARKKGNRDAEENPATRSARNR